jgi:hypothetical protein
MTDDNNTAIDAIRIDEDVLSYTVSDEALEAAAGTEMGCSRWTGTDKSEARLPVCPTFSRDSGTISAISAAPAPSQLGESHRLGAVGQAAHDLHPGPIGRASRALLVAVRSSLRRRCTILAEAGDVRFASLGDKEFKGLTGPYALFEVAW